MTQYCSYFAKIHCTDSLISHTSLLRLPSQKLCLYFLEKKSKIDQFLTTLTENVIMSCLFLHAGLQSFSGLDNFRKKTLYYLSLSFTSGPGAPFSGSAFSAKVIWKANVSVFEDFWDFHMFYFGTQLLSFLWNLNNFSSKYPIHQLAFLVAVKMFFKKFFCEQILKIEFFPHFRSIFSFDSGDSSGKSAQFGNFREIVKKNNSRSLWLLREILSLGFNTRKSWKASLLLCSENRCFFDVVHLVT